MITVEPIADAVEIFKPILPILPGFAPKVRVVPINPFVALGAPLLISLAVFVSVTIEPLVPNVILNEPFKSKLPDMKVRFPLTLILLFVLTLNAPLLTVKLFIVVTAVGKLAV